MSVFDDTLFDALTQDLDDGLILVDSCTHALRWNPAALAMHGCIATAQDLDSLESLAAAYDLRTPEGTHLAVDRRPIAQVLRGEPVKDLEILLRRKQDGWERLLSYSGRLVGGSGDQAPTAVITVRDITDRKQSERALREQETFLQLAYEAADLGIVHNDLATGEVVFDARARAHYGFDVPRVPRAELQARIHPDDVDRLQREVAAVTAAAPAGVSPPNTV